MANTWLAAFEHEAATAEAWQDMTTPFADRAAERYVESVEWARAEFPVASGLDSVTVVVRRPDAALSDHLTFIVSGESRPRYFAKKISAEPTPQGDG